MPAFRRAGVACLAATAAIGLAACGGDSEKEQADEYKGALNTFCRSVKSAQKDVEAQIQKVQSDPAAASDPEAAIKGFGRALGSFGEDLRGALGGLRDADPPEEFQRFHDGAVKAIDQLAGKVEQAAKATESGDTDALQSFGADVDKIDVPDVPADLKKGVPACDELSSS